MWNFTFHELFAPDIKFSNNKNAPVSSNSAYGAHNLSHPVFL